MAIVVAGATLPMVALVRTGVRLGGDTSRYLDGGAQLFSSGPLSGSVLPYLGYVATVGLFQEAGLGTSRLVVFQITVAVLATVALFDLGRRLAGDVAGLIAAGFFATYIDFVKWHVYILTESLFISAVVLTFWALDTAARRGGSWYAVGVLGLGVTALLRPNGWLLLPIGVSYWALLRLPSARPRLRIGVVAGIVAAFVAFAGLAPMLTAGTDAAKPAEMLREGAVIWGDPSTWVTMPSDRGRGEGFAALSSYAVRHPVATAKVAALRVGTELMRVRGYYSMSRNLLILGFLVPIYGFAIAGLRTVIRQPLGRMMLAFAATQLALVAATFADYDGRFLLYILPFVMIFSGVGVQRAVTALVGRLATANA